MSWNTPPIFAGGVPDDSDWQIIVDDFIFIHSPPSCTVSHSGNQSVVTGTPTALSMNTELGDTDGMHSTIVNTSRITFQTAGRYYVCGRISFDGASAGGRSSAIRESGSDNEAVHSLSVTNFVPGNAVDAYLAADTVFVYSATDYIELVANQNSGTTLQALANEVLLAAHWLSA